MSAQEVTPEDTRSLLSPAEVAELANVSRKTIYREVERDALPVRHAGRQLRVDPCDLRRWLEGGAVR
jgi:excisionase family DNA binding protein